MHKAAAVMAASALVLSLVPAGALAEASHDVVPAAQQDGSDVAVSAQSDWWGYFEPVDAAVDVLKAHDWIAAPGMAPNAKAFKAWFEGQLGALDLAKVQVRADYASLRYTAPVDGTADQREGTPGSFTIEVRVYRSWLDALAARHVTVGGTLEAIPYQGPAADEGDDTGTNPDPGDQGGSTGDDAASGDDATAGTTPDAPAGGNDQNTGSDPDAPSVPQPPKPDTEGDTSGSDQAPDASRPTTPPVADGSDAVGPATIEEAAGTVKRQLADRVAADASALSIGRDAMQDASFADQASAKAAVSQWVRGLLDAAGMIPAGYRYDLGEPEVTLPTETAAGSFRCPVYLEKDAANVTHPLSSGSDASAQPLEGAERATSVSASAGQQASSSKTVREPDLYVEGTIAPRVVQAAGEGNGKDDANGSSDNDQEQADQPTGKHPLAQPQPQNDDDAIDMINSAEQLEGEGAPRPIKRPGQIDGQERPASLTSTGGIQYGSTIASTDDPMATVMRSMLVLFGAAAAVAMLCLTRFRKIEDEH